MLLVSVTGALLKSVGCGVCAAGYRKNHLAGVEQDVPVPFVH